MPVLICLCLIFAIFVNVDLGEKCTTNEQLSSKTIAHLEQQVKRDNDIFKVIFGEEWSRDDALFEAKVTITAYSSSVDQTDSTPHQTADMSTVRVGLIAVSRDLLDELGLVMGERVFIPGYGMFEIRDKMNKRYRRRVDIWMADRTAAELHGVKQGLLYWFG